MKEGISLSALAQQLEAEQNKKRDFTAPAKSVSFTGEKVVLENIGEFVPTQHALNQITDFAGIPRKYAHRMREEAPHLLSSNVNHWLGETEKPRMIRTVADDMRAFVSNRFRRLDNFDLMKAILPTLAEMKLSVKSTGLTDTKMHMKFTLPSLTGEVRVGEVVEMGVALSNSEVGDGSVLVNPFIFILACTNGMLMNKAVNRYHVGRAVTASDDIAELLTDEAIIADDKAFWLSVRDVVKGALTEEFFVKQLNIMKHAAGEPIVADTRSIVELTKKQYLMSDEQGDALLENLIRGGDLTQWGLSNAVTFMANTTDDYAEATRLEAIGGSIIELPSTEWKVMNAAA